MPNEKATGPKSRSAGVLWLVGLRFVIIALQIINIKYAVKFLGEGSYGIAILIANVRAMWQFVDLDIPQGLVQVLSRTFRVDEEKAWRYFRSGLFLHLVIGLIGMVGMFLGAYYLTGNKDLQRPDLGALCILAGLQFFFDVYGSAYNAPFNAREQFHKVAALTSLIPIFSVGLSIVLVAILKTPVAVLLGTLIDSVLQFVVKMAFIIRKEKDFPILPLVDLPHSREIVKTGLKSYVAGLSTRIGGTADKVIVFSVLGKEVLTVYNLACRIPQILLEAFGKIAESVTPEMTHVSANEPHRLAEIFRRNFRFIGFVAAVGIVFVGGFGDVILKAWMFKSYENFGILVFLMGIYYGLELHHSTITRVFFAQGKAHLMLPFTLWNSIITVAMTKFLATRFGLIGVASMNCFIDVAQIIPIHYYCTRYGVKDLTLGELLRITFSILGIGVVFGLGALYATSHMTFSKYGSYAMVLGIIPLCVLLSVVYIRSGLVSLPNGIRMMIAKSGILKRLFGSQPEIPRSVDPIDPHDPMNPNA